MRPLSVRPFSITPHLYFLLLPTLLSLLYKILYLTIYIYIESRIFIALVISGGWSKRTTSVIEKIGKKWISSPNGDIRNFTRAVSPFEIDWFLKQGRCYPPFHKRNEEFLSNISKFYSHISFKAVDFAIISHYKPILILEGPFSEKRHLFIRVNIIVIGICSSTNKWANYFLNTLNVLVNVIKYLVFF